MREELVVIDAAHGGQRDAGRSSAFGSGGREKDVTLQLAKRVAARLGGGAVLTRTSDVNRSLAERIEVARQRGAAVFVSLHAGSGPRVGAFVHPRASGDSWLLGESLRTGLSRFGNPTLSSGELAVLAPDWLPRRTAACALDVGSQPRNVDELAGAVAQAIRGHLRRRYGRTAALDSPPDPTRQNPNDVINAQRDAEALRQAIQQQWGQMEDAAKQALLRQLRDAPGSVIAAGVLLGGAGVGILLNTQTPVPSLPGIPLDFLGPDFKGISVQPVVRGQLDNPSFVGFNIKFSGSTPPPRHRQDAPAEPDIDAQLAGAGTSVEQIAASIETPDLETETPGLGPDSNMDATQNREELVRGIGQGMLVGVHDDDANPWVDLRTSFPTALPFHPKGLDPALSSIVRQILDALPNKFPNVRQVTVRLTIGGQEQWIPVVLPDLAAN
jgi:N-acetylmuramoyl-L-alanine amidase